MWSHRTSSILHLVKAQQNEWTASSMLNVVVIKNMYFDISLNKLLFTVLKADFESPVTTDNK